MSAVSVSVAHGKERDSQDSQMSENASASRVRSEVGSGTKKDDSHSQSSQISSVTKAVEEAKKKEETSAKKGKKGKKGAKAA